MPYRASGTVTGTEGAQVGDNTAGGAPEPGDQEVAEQTTSSELDESRADAPFTGGGGEPGGELLEPHELGQYGDPYQTGDPGRTT